MNYRKKIRRRIKSNQRANLRYFSKPINQFWHEWIWSTIEYSGLAVLFIQNFRFVEPYQLVKHYRCFKYSSSFRQLGILNKYVRWLKQWRTILLKRLKTTFQARKPFYPKSNPSPNSLRNPSNRFSGSSS